MSDNSSDKLIMSDKKKYPSDDQIRKTVRLSDEQAENWDNKLIQWVLSDENIELVRRVMKGNLVSSDNSSDEKTLIDCILEFNKLMDHNQDVLSAPDKLDFEKIQTGVELSFQKKNPT